MTARTAMELLKDRWAEKKFVCLGLDIDYKRIPDFLKPGNSLKGCIVQFARSIIDATRDLVCAYKLNYSFYEAYGPEGIAALKTIVQYILVKAPDVLIIIDGKRQDIGNTNTFTAMGMFDELGAHALTIHNYLGSEAVAEQFLDHTDKLFFVLCRTSNKGAREFQDLVVTVPDYGFDEIAQGVSVDDEFVMPWQMPLYQYVAARVNYVWNRDRGNCGLVTGATYPDDIAKVRAIAPTMPLLIPGIGTQGGDLEASVKNGRTKNGNGFIINSSSGLLYASNGADYAEAARMKTEELDHAICEV